jgi:hypothetical protein
MNTLVKNRMTASFKRLSDSLTSNEAVAQLAGDAYGIVVDSGGSPVALVSAEDVKQAASQGVALLKDSLANLPPVVVIGSEVTMQALAESSTMTLFDIGARGAVLLDDANTIVGVLPLDAIDEYLGSGAYELLIKTMGSPSNVGDANLGGSHQTPVGKVICKACSFVNTVTYLDKKRLPACQNPNVPSHTLKL